MAEMKDLHAEEKILKLEIKDRYGWNFLSQYSDEKEDVFPDEQPVALFLTLGRPDYWGNRDLSVSTSISTHEDLGYGRFTVMNDENDDILDVEFKPYVHWSKCLVDSDELVPDFLVLEEFGGEYFSQYPKEGNRMDTGEIMFRVETIEAIGEPTFFETTDCLFFLKYHINEVKAIAPSEANAYIILDEVSPGNTVKVPVQFFKVQVDATHRILRPKEVMSNLPLLLEINGVTI